MPSSHYSDDFKEKIVKEIQETGNMTLVVKRREIAPTTIQQWLSNFNKYSVISKEKKQKIQI
ncbi:hypothetical protein BBF96_09735 [Anoxybacter fermentans]|uniref:Transposase n=1 Tax=Anoxybacter fermentans TaxID=1323375 RepID=A0A3Q9HR76_9FIRM|nr:helix-turn-helix domain-containing protein [Anoxybacter fermentans]AZR73643.1 hypothetical protein BBF96_09735 [Anoxybacter fermentans]